MAVAAFLYGWSAVVLHDLLTLLVLPPVWLTLFALACRWFLTRPHRVLVLPVVATGVRFAAMLA